MSEKPDRAQWKMTGAIATNRTAPPIPLTSEWVRAEYADWADAEIARLQALIDEHNATRNTCYHIGRAANSSDERQ